MEIVKKYTLVDRVHTIQFDKPKKPKVIAKFLKCYNRLVNIFKKLRKNPFTVNRDNGLDYQISSF